MRAVGTSVELTGASVCVADSLEFLTCTTGIDVGMRSDDVVMN